MVESLMPRRESAAKCGRVAVMMGGMSAEREISLKSGNAVFEGLIKAGVDAFKFDPQQDILRRLLDLKGKAAPYPAWIERAALPPANPESLVP